MAELYAMISTIVVLVTSMVTVTVFIVTMKGDIKRGDMVAKAQQKQITEINDCVAAYRIRHETEHKEVDNHLFDNQREISNVSKDIQFIKEILVEIKDHLAVKNKGE
jgi:hypothetical protein